MARHVLHIPDLPGAGERLTVSGDEAAHALRVKRVREGDEVVLLDGAGVVATADVIGAGRELELRIASTERIPPASPAIEVFSAAPKGPRLGELIDNLSQVGAASWTPLRTKRANVDPTAAKRKRLERITVEAMKQCRRPWMLEIQKPASFEESLAVTPGTTLIIADAIGEPYRRSGASRIRLLIGPEGGWTDQELRAARAAGGATHCFGPHVMRIELATAAACAIMLDYESRTQ